MSERLVNEQVKVRVLPEPQVVKDGAILEITFTNEDLTLTSQESTAIFFSSFEGPGGIGVQKKVVPDESTFNNGIEQLKHLGVDGALISELETVGYDGNFTPQLNKISEELVSRTFMSDNSDALPELYVSHNSEDRIVFTFSPIPVLPDKLDAQTSNALKTAISRNDDAKNIEVTIVQDNKLFGRFEFLFEVDLGEELGKKLLRSSSINEYPNDFGEPTKINVKYGNNAAYSLSQKLRDDTLDAKVKEKYQIAIDNIYKQNLKGILPNFEAQYGRSPYDVIEEQPKIKAKIDSVENAGQNTAFIVLSDLEFED